MKKIVSIILAGAAALAAVSCAKQELVQFDNVKATAPVVNSYEITEDGVFVDFTAGSFNQSFNQNMPVNHSLVLLTANGNPVNKVLSSSINGNIISVSTNALCRTLIAQGFEEGDIVSMEMALRASMQEPARDNLRNGYVEATGRVNVPNFEVVVPKGSPYEGYDEISTWSVIGSIAAYEMSWDKDLVMWTDGQGNHVAAHVKLAAGDEFKFRKDASWDVNLGGTFQSLDTEFSVEGNGANIIVGADGYYDLFVNTNSNVAWVSAAYDPYPDYTETSTWSVIGALSKYDISWNGDLAMITDGTNHVALSISLAADDEFKFRKDASWDVNLGGTFTALDEDFSVEGNGANIIVGTEGVYDLFVNPDAGTAKVAKASGAKVSYIAGGDEPEPEPEPVTGWNIIGLNGDWDNDILASAKGNVWTAYITATENTEFKWRKDGGWDENYGGTFVAFGEPFAAEAGGSNIAVSAGFYKVVLDLDDTTITVYDDFEVWSLIGEFNGWAGDVDMELVEGKWIAEDVNLTPGWKLRKNHGWDENRGGAFVALDEPFAVTNGGDNIDCGEGRFTVIYDPTEETVTIKEGTVWSLIGDFNSWGADVDMTLENGLWVAEGVELSGGWKLRKNHGWDVNRGGVFVSFGEAFEAVQGGDNINCGEGMFNVVYDPAAETITVSASSYGWSIIGANGDWNTDIDMFEVAPGIWMSASFTTTTDWKLRYDHGWDVNRGGATPSGEGVFVEAVQNGDNIGITGTFKVVYNANNETVGTLVWGLVGSIASIEGFNWNNDIPMNLASDGKWYSVPVALTTSDEFKLRQYGGWDVNRGGNCTAVDEAFAVENNGSNIVAPADGTYMLVYDPAAETVVLSTAFWGVIGDFCSWGADVFMMFDGENWVAYNQPITGGWKIREGAAVAGGDNIDVAGSTIFDIIYTPTAETITIR